MNGSDSGGDPRPLAAPLPNEFGVDDDDMVKLVRRFYALSYADPVLGPFFIKTIADYESAHFDAHVRVVADFWSSMLLKTGRYQGNPFLSHAKHPIEPGHFDIWLKLFKQATAETLPAPLAAQAMAKADMMARSLKAGLFTLPARKPPE